MAKNLSEFMKIDKLQSKWEIQHITLNRYGKVAATGDRLIPASINPSEFEKMIKKFRQNFNPTNSVDEIRKNMKNDIERLDNLLKNIKFDFVIDGLNIGFQNNRGYNHNNLQKIIKLVEANAKHEKKTFQVLIVLR